MTFRLQFLILQLVIISFAHADLQFDPSDLRENDPAVCRIHITRSSGTGLCTGTLIAPQLVLTAAHCMPEFAKAAVRVDCGYRDGLPFVESHQAERGRFFTDFQGDSNDLALIKLVGTSNIKPMKLISKKSKELMITKKFVNHRNQKNLECRLAGYGIGPRDLMNILNTVAINRGSLRITGNSLETAPQKVYVKGGDSGGPLYCRLNGNEWFVVGVVKGFRSADREKTRRRTVISPLETKLFASLLQEGF